VALRVDPATAPGRVPLLCDDHPLGRQKKNETRDNRKMRLKTPATIEFRDLTGLVKKLKIALAALRRIHPGQRLYKLVAAADAAQNSQ
jgi:hypothetical protein